MTFAIVVGGSANVWDEISSARSICSDLEPAFFVTNDMIALFPEGCFACSLHEIKLPGWIASRAERGFPAPFEVWCHLFFNNGAMTHQINEWKDAKGQGGSSGLLAVKVALSKGFDRVILAGVPVQTECGHVVRQRPWTAAYLFQDAWCRHAPEMRGKVKSFSGFTADLLGRPSRDWLSSIQEAA